MNRKSKRTEEDEQPIDRQNTLDEWLHNDVYRIVGQIYKGRSLRRRRV